MGGEDVRGREHEESDQTDDARSAAAESENFELAGADKRAEDRARAPAATARDLPPVLTAQELGALLRLRPRSVYEAIRRREIPGVRRIGRKVRVDRDTIVKWLADGQGRVSRSPRRTQ